MPEKQMLINEAVVIYDIAQIFRFLEYNPECRGEHGYGSDKKATVFATLTSRKGWLLHLW
jgi:hypothetical protein